MARKDPSEEQIHVALVNYLFRFAKPDVLYYHVPNGGARSAVTGARLKRMGTLAGVPDLVFQWKGYFEDHRESWTQHRTLYLELKARGRKPTDAQDLFRRRAQNAGADWECVDDLGRAIEVLKSYGILKNSHV